MITIKALKEGNVFRPAEDYPIGTAKVVFNGTDYCCYDAEETAIIEKAEAEEAEQGE